MPQQEAGIAVLLEGKKGSEANSMDEESSRKSHGGTAWEGGGFLQNKGLFYLLSVLEKATAA